MHKTTLRYVFCNGSIYSLGWMFMKLLESAPDPVDPYVWHIPIYPVFVLPMIFFNVLYLSGFLGDLKRHMDEQ